MFGKLTVGEIENNNCGPIPFHYSKLVIFVQSNHSRPYYVAFTPLNHNSRKKNIKCYESFAVSCM